MDVPLWHPANQDASHRLLAAASTAATKRTEFKVMPGSSADTSTEAGRQFVDDLSGGGAFVGRGFIDTSDRLYLLEQKRIEEEQKSKRRAEEEAYLHSFRSTALKLQTQKPPLLPLDAVGAASSAKASGAAASTKRAASGAGIDGKKAPAAAVVTIKAKKRKAPALDESKSSDSSTVKKKQRAGTVSARADTKDVPKAAADANRAVASPPLPAPAPAPAKKAAAAAPNALLLGYSSSGSDADDGSDKEE